MKKYKLIAADPPWNYSNAVSNGAAGDHYRTMKLEDIKRLPVWDVADDDAVLAMWYTGTHVREAMDVAEAWGFQVRQMFLFTWVKMNQKSGERMDKALENGEVWDSHDVMAWLDKEVKINAGNYTRQNQESMLVAVRGRGLERQSASVRQIVFSCPGEHSAKPKEVMHRLVELYGDVPRLEMFARSSMPGWDCWGNEAPNKAIEFVKGHAVVPFDWNDPSHPMNPNNNLMHFGIKTDQNGDYATRVFNIDTACSSEDSVTCPGCRKVLSTSELQTGIHVCPPVAPESGE